MKAFLKSSTTSKARNSFVKQKTGRRFLFVDKNIFRTTMNHFDKMTLTTFVLAMIIKTTSAKKTQKTKNNKIIFSLVRNFSCRSMLSANFLSQVLCFNCVDRRRLDSLELPIQPPKKVSSTKKSLTFSKEISVKLWRFRFAWLRFHK